MKKILYLSYDGLTDPLGSSQVLPYIIGLSKLGYFFTVISFEKKEVYEKGKKGIFEEIESHNITWIPLIYTKHPPIVSTVWDILQLWKIVKKINKQNDFSIVHCRSYITSLIGLKMKQKWGTKFIFDMRGFYADERVDGGLWKLNNPVFKRVYNYFKKKEKQFLESADHTISLTFKAKKIIHSWNLSNNPVPISVVPTCVDTDHFTKEKISIEQREKIKTDLNIRANHFVLSYVGSLGTWYCLDEMMLFFKKLIQKIPEAVFLIITRDDPSQIQDLAHKHGIPNEKIKIRAGQRAEMPTLISLSDWSIFFIKPVFSKSASAPTKMGELINLGVPIVCNTGVGDIDDFCDKYQLGIGISLSDDTSYDRAINMVVQNRHLKIETNLVSDMFSLEKGLKQISEIYQSLLL